MKKLKQSLLTRLKWPNGANHEKKTNIANGARFRMPEPDFVKDVTTALVPDVSPDELADFDDSSFDIVSEGDACIPTADEFRKRLENVCVEVRRVEPAVQLVEEQASLFPGLGMMDAVPQSGSRFHFEVSRQRFSSLIPLVVQAFVDVRDGWSADYVLLNPDKDLDFLQRCWRLGAVAAPEELNWTLMNARKDGKLKGLSSARSFALAKSEMDKFCFASEMAMRELQERARIEEQRDNTARQVALQSKAFKRL